MSMIKLVSLLYEMKKDQILQIFESLEFFMTVFVSFWACLNSANCGHAKLLDQRNKKIHWMPKCILYKG